MNPTTQTTPVPEIIEEQEKTINTENKVLLFNDDWHTFEEVIVQIIKAIKCSFEQARSFAFEAHTNGKTMVFSGSIQECLRVSSVLEEIALNTQIIS